MTPNIPIEPVNVEGLAIILLAGVEIQYPPDAAIPPIETTTCFFSCLKAAISLRICSDADTLPPGLLTRNTNALILGFKRA